ncbi:hypothetical protein P691DRAFT_812910 [Macrolepiota fuliginosa MF-IS2]|uniref:Uncharacterized protein n=1 Tax=Macrolepiota fuliginosa MF-IS2 TaxID=1400762 RepID=A0A9P5WYT3_9AGAR|nr:hypothetical protein P691DRAFT_812910 [Macrolepiota fuliginosa MF-IS2]
MIAPLSPSGSYPNFNNTCMNVKLRYHSSRPSGSSTNSLPEPQCLTHSVRPRRTISAAREMMDTTNVGFDGDLNLD